MKIGIFDSGLGGLVIAKAIFSAKGSPRIRESEAGGPASHSSPSDARPSESRTGGKNLSAYDYIYLGDTKRLPYGNRSADEVYKFTRNAVKYLFDRNCQLVILACNTASALALRKIQQEFLPKFYPERRVLGVVIPTLEEADKNHKQKIIGVIGTAATIRSHIYKKELMKIDPNAKIIELATPKLVPLIEQNALQKAENALKLYLKPLQKQGIGALILGCTHYPILARQIKKIVGKKIKVVSQTDFLPNKLGDYLKRHPEINSKLSKSRKRLFLVTNYNHKFGEVAKRLFGRSLEFKVVSL